MSVRCLCGVVSGLAEDPVEVRAAHGAHALGHPGALVVDAHLALCLALLLALHAVELAAPGLRHDGLLVRSRSRSSRRGIRGSPPGPGPRNGARSSSTLRHAGRTA